MDGGIPINDYYKPKGAEEGISVTTFVNCSYWISTTVAERLKKGSLVEVSGRMSVHAYMGLDGEAKASLQFHVNNLSIHHSAKASAPAIADTAGPMDDLPF